MKKRKYTCMGCGNSVLLDPEEVIGNNIVYCDACQQKLAEKDTKKAGPALDTALAIGAKMVFDKVITTVGGETKTIESFLSDNGFNLDDHSSVSAVNISDPAFKDWVCIGNIRNAYISGELQKYRDYVGLYAHTVDGKVMYIGRATELNHKGLYKRLYDYFRASDSARKHQSGRTINANLDRIITYVLTVGSDEEAVLKTIQLEKEYVGKFNPPWNKQLKTQ